MHLPRYRIELREDFQEFESDSLRVESRGKVSLSYRTDVIATSSDRRLISILGTGETVKLYIMSGSEKRSVISSGIARDISVNPTSEGVTIRFSIENKTFDFLKNKDHDSNFNGDVASQIRNVVKLDGVGVKKTYEGSVVVKENRRGRLFDTLMITSYKTGLVWNLFNDKIYIGDVLSESPTLVLPNGTFSKSFSYYRTRTGEMLKKVDVNTKFRPGISAGDTVEIDNHVFIVGSVNHFYFEIGGNAQFITKMTSMMLFPTIDDVLKFVLTEYDPENVNDLVFNLVPQIEYDFEENEIVFFDKSRISKLADLQIRSFSGSLLGPLEEYMNFQGLLTSSTFGVYVPGDVVITGVSFTVDSSDDASFAVTRNGDVISTVYIGNSVSGFESKSETFLGNGIMGAKYVPGPSASGVSGAVMEVYYRRLFA